MVGFGMVRGMQESLKMNRAQLKKHRKSHKEMAEINPSRSKTNSLNQCADPKVLDQFKSDLALKRKKEGQQKLLLFTIVLLVVAGLGSLIFI